jgi:pimeloyl-ACP methyl ester carboxylesterase
VKHIRRFMETLCIERAHFIGNSMGGSMLITVAAEEQPPWNMDKIVVVSGGGVAPENEAREILNSYDCTKEHMREIMKVIFAQERFWNDQAYIEKRYNASLVPGAWECTAAARFKSPAASVSGKRRPKTYGTIQSPTLIVAGAQDRLRYPGYADELAKQIPGSKLHVFEQAGHCSHIEFPDAFNKLVIDFLKE